jgi:VWFA-related protein
VPASCEHQPACPPARSQDWPPHIGIMETMLRVIKVLCVPLLASLAAAQSDEPLARVNTRLVEVDVVVRSKTGPITGLTKEDFKVTDNGKPQTVAAFRLMSRENRPSTSTQLPEGVVSNRLMNREAEAAGVTVLLVDRVNTSDSDQTEVRRQLLHYLETAPKGERLALYSLSKTLRVIQDFTSDPAVLRKKVFSNGSAESSVDLTAELFAEDLPVTGDAMTDAMTQNAANEMKDEAVRRRVDLTAYALELIAKHLEGLAGRKKLLWFSSSFPAEYSYQGSRNGRQQIEVREFSGKIEKAAKALNQANVAVYPVDPRNPYDGGFSAPGIDTMNLLAGKTGGRAFYVINDMEAAIKTIVDDDEVTYMLGFYPADVKLDGSFHPISVKVARPGVEVRYRKGYFASDSKPPTEKQRTTTLEEAFLNPLESTGIGLAGRTTQAEGKPGIYNVDLNLNLSELHLERENGRWVALLAIATEFSAKHRPNGTLENIKLTLTEDRLREVLRTGYPLRRPFTAGELTGELRVVVQDRITGDAGSLSLHIGPQKPGH